MADAGIRDGDDVYFAPATSGRAARGKIVVIGVNEDVHIKYYHEAGGQRMLLGAKAGSSPLIIKDDDETTLYGIVVLPRRRQS